ncbi:MAG: HAMP domain-containing histidine kinase [Ruminococcus flavefaciens]|nr:HAMP domain-containing histidine kinase [Ruminococcus flavefaciens]MCM1062025.1 HAMP domain-containing histidine kinase [Eubacterium sp.]
MFRKVHIRLTMVFTTVCTLILAIMSIFYLYLNYCSIYNNAFTSFQNDMTIFSSEFSKSHTISHEWLQSIQKDYNYNLFVYDNNAPMKFTLQNKSDSDLMLIENIKQHFTNDVNQMHRSTISQHKEISCSINGNKIFISIITIPGKNGNTEIYAIDILKNEREQMWKLGIHFIIIIILAFAALFIFSYVFTRMLLKPIRQAHEQQAHFIAAASHEIRNPVNTIISALDAMGKCEGNQHDNFANIARKEGKRLMLLTEDLLTLARSDNGNFTSNFVPAELDTILLDCYEAFMAPAQEKEIHINIKLPEENVPKANIDSERIKQVISVLLSNAVSYTPERGKIDISYSVETQWHIIIISDNGSGISDEDKRHIFERFYRADHAREDRSHFGLGLAIAKEIIDLHNGKIFVKDNDSGGASFIVYIPVT